MLTILVQSNKKADILVSRGLKVEGKRLKVERYIKDKSNMIYRYYIR